MLAIPSVQWTGEGIEIPTPENYLPTKRDVRLISTDFDLRLGEGSRIVHIKVHKIREENLIQTIAHYTLEEFSVVRNSARFEFRNLNGAIIEGGSAAVYLEPNLCVKLVMPVVLLPSRHGLRTTFRFRTDPDCKVLTLNEYKRLFEE